MRSTRPNYRLEHHLDAVAPVIEVDGRFWIETRCDCGAAMRLACEREYPSTLARQLLAGRFLKGAARTSGISCEQCTEPDS